MKLKYRPIMLLILDGWGYSAETRGNAIAAANTPNFNKLWHTYPHTLLQACGLAVGLPEGQMGNSEVGHLHIGAGRRAPQDLTRISEAIASGEFMQNPVLVAAITKLVQTQKALHIFGLVSDGGVHSHTTHIQAVIELADKLGLKQIYVHAFLDSRDTPPKSASAYLQAIEKTLQKVNAGQIASISGRFYAMDRDKRWDRVQLAYDMLTQGKTEFHAASAEEALQLAYERGETDEFVKPTCVQTAAEKFHSIQDGDAIIFMNFRADRAREITQAFTDENFANFPRAVRPKLADYITLTQYSAELQTQIAFLPIDLKNVLGEVIANKGLTQLRIAETEKYAHVTYFLNGGEEKQFLHEDRILVQSPKVATYDLQPEMSIYQVTEKLLAAIATEKYDFIACNFANPDMLGHTGSIEATVKALEAVDDCLGKTFAAIKQAGGELVIISDHGNAEQMVSEETGQAHTAHTCSPVPFIYVGRAAVITHDNGSLVDVAPTLLYLLGVDQPSEMTGKRLINIENQNV
jgi:2,3-bisphosphoglycerate-independent phosphoglycerate mutase